MPIIDLKAIETFGGIDILVSNAAVNPTYEPLINVSEEAWDKVMDVNLKSAFMLSKLVIPHMMKRGGGSIIFVSSITAYTPFKNMGPYSISKTALVALTRILSAEQVSANIRVNCIAPGLIRTDFSSALWADSDGTEAKPLKPPMSIGMGRLGSPDECAGTVVFLASDDASYITGETIVISGGMRSRL